MSLSFNQGAHNFNIDSAQFINTRNFHAHHALSIHPTSSLDAQGTHTFESGRASFVNAQNFHVHHAPSSDPTSILDANRATEATHKSTTAEDAPKCNPKTRKKVIGDLMEWVGTPPAPKSILWFDGPAGAGKTCIMREVVVQCEAIPGTVTASYFFSTRVDGLTIERPFIATIAHQLAYSGVPGLKTAILQAISDNPFIFRDGLKSQMEALIVEPLRGCGFSNLSFAPNRRVVIVVDGLDECKEEPERKHLLGLLLSLINKLSPSLIVIIASRPELDIRITFDRPEFKNATHAVRLHDYDGRDDVRTFYCDEFENIRQTHPLRHYIPAGWITEEILRVLVTKSSGHFIYPSVIMKYIAGQPRRNPVQLLEKAMTTSTSDTDNPLAELDALYTLILHPPAVDFPLMRRLLHLIVHAPSFGTAAATLDEFLRLTSGATDAALCDLHSILYIPIPPFHPERSSAICFHHKSLEDFLCSPSRSKDLFLLPSVIQVDLVLASIWFLQSWANNPMEDGTPFLRFASSQSIPYIQKFARSNQTIPDAILDFDPRCLLEYRFVHYRDWSLEAEFQDLRAVLHQNHCAGRSECAPLCMGLLAIYRSMEKVNLANYPLRKRLALLPKFKAESGLYSPEWKSIGGAEPLSRKRKLDSPDGPSATRDPPRTRLTAKSLFVCDYKDQYPDARDSDSDFTWKKSSKEFKDIYRERAKNAPKKRAQKKLKTSHVPQAHHQEHAQGISVPAGNSHVPSSGSQDRVVTTETFERQAMDRSSAAQPTIREYTGVAEDVWGGEL